MNVFLLGILCVVMGLSQAQPTPCCMPDAFTVTEVLQAAVVYGSTVQYTTTYENVAIDMTNKMVGVQETIYFDDGTAYEVKVIEDFNKMVIYTISGLSCSVSAIPSDYMLDTCIPDDATLLGVDKAPLNGVSVDVATWSWYYEENGMSGYIRATVLADDCRVSSEQFMGDLNSTGTPQHTVFSVTFADFAYGVSQPERFFTVPISCQTQDIDVSPETLPHRHLGWFFKSKKK